MPSLRKGGPTHPRYRSRQEVCFRGAGGRDSARNSHRPSQKLPHRKYARSPRELPIDNEGILGPLQITSPNILARWTWMEALRLAFVSTLLGGRSLLFVGSQTPAPIQTQAHERARAVRALFAVMRCFRNRLYGTSRPQPA